MSIDKAEIKQEKFAEQIDKLKAYSAKSCKCIDLKESVFKNTKKFYDEWEKLFMGLKMENYYSLKSMVQKLRVVINNQIFPIHWNREDIMIFYAKLKKRKKVSSKKNAGILKQYSRGIPLAFQR